MATYRSETILRRATICLSGILRWWCETRSYITISTREWYTVERAALECRIRTELASWSCGVILRGIDKGEVTALSSPTLHEGKGAKKKEETDG